MQHFTRTTGTPASRAVRCEVPHCSIQLTSRFTWAPNVCVTSELYFLCLLFRYIVESSSSVFRILFYSPENPIDSEIGDCSTKPLIYLSMSPLLTHIWHFFESYIINHISYSKLVLNVIITIIFPSLKKEKIHI